MASHSHQSINLMLMTVRKMANLMQFIDVALRQLCSVDYYRVHKKHFFAGAFNPNGFLLQ